MGFAKFGEFRKKQKLEGTKVTAEDVGALNVHVDFGYYFYRVRKKLHQRDLSVARTTFVQEQQHHNYVSVRFATSDFQLVATPPVQPFSTGVEFMVDFDLKRLGVNPTTTVIHMDGPATAEKVLARTKRDKVVNDKREKAAAILQEAQTCASNGQRCKTQGIYRLLEETRKMTQVEKESIRDQLVGLGWSVHICSGEADVCMARSAAASNDPNFAVLTRDSDLLMHRPVTKVLMLAKGGLELITRQDVLKAFKLDEDQLQLLAVVSTSDFCKSIDGYGLIRNHKVIQKLQVPPESPNRLQLLLQQYQNSVRNPETLDTTNSFSIFVNRTETPAGPAAPPVAGTVVAPQVSNSDMAFELLQARRLYIANKQWAPPPTNRRLRRRTSYAVRPVHWNQNVNDAPAPVSRPPKRPLDSKNNNKGKGKKRKEDGDDDDDTVPRFRISSRAARDREYGMKGPSASVPSVGSSTGPALQQAAHEAAQAQQEDVVDEMTASGENEKDTLREMELNQDDTMDVEQPSTVPTTDPQASEKKKAENLWFQLSNRQAMATLELGSLEKLLGKNLHTRILATSVQLVEVRLHDVLRRYETAQRWLALVQSTPEYAREIVSARRLVQEYRGNYNSAMQDIQVLGAIDPVLKAELEAAYLEPRMYTGTLDASPREKMATGRLIVGLLDNVPRITQLTASYLQSIVHNMSRWYHWIHHALCLFVASIVWDPSQRTADKKAQVDEDLRAILNTTRGRNIVRWTGNYLSGMDSNLPLRTTITDRERVQRIAITAARLLRECCPTLVLPSIPASQREIYADMTTTLSDKFAEFFTTSLSALLEETQTKREVGKDAITQYISLNTARKEQERWSFFSRPAMGDRWIKFSNKGLRNALMSTDCPTKATMELLFPADADLPQELFFEGTRHRKVTMSMREYCADEDSLQTNLKRQWSERDQQKAANQAVETGPRKQKSRRPKRYKVTSGAITTNGLVVHGLVFDTSQRKPGAVQAGSSPLRGVPLLGGKKDLDPKVQAHLDAHKNTLHVAGLDPGEVITCACTTLPPSAQVKTATNTLASRGSLYQATNDFNRKLQLRKAEKTILSDDGNVGYPSINEIEALTPRRRQIGMESLQQYIKWYGAFERILNALYCSLWYKRRQWDRTKQDRGDYERAFDAILRSASATGPTSATARVPAMQVDPNTGYSMNLAIVIGNGQFASGIGRSSRHRTLTAFIVKKARRLGILVFQLNEAYTSSRCPRDHSPVVKYIRSVECCTCSIFLHRDSAGAHNIAYIGREHIQGRGRPLAFQKPAV
ncbi:unnamed protein product [Mortierella alpina]